MARLLRLAVLAFASIVPAAAQFCAPLGPVFPAPTNLAQHPLMRAAAANLTAELDAFTAGSPGSGINAVYTPNNTHSSVGVRSIYDAAPLFEHHHMPAAGGGNSSLNSTTQLTGDSVYRIGSVSKVYTVLLLLLQEGKVSLDDPVTKYVPELAARATRESIENVDWKRITLGALASHLAGIGRTCEEYSQLVSVSTSGSSLRCYMSTTNVIELTQALTLLDRSRTAPKRHEGGIRAGVDYLPAAQRFRITHVRRRIQSAPVL